MKAPSTAVPPTVSTVAHASRWPIVPLMRLVDARRPVMYGIVLPGPHVDGGVPLVKGGDVSAEKLAMVLLNRVDPAIEGRHTRSRLQGGDVVYAIRGSIGAVARVPSELSGANITQDVARVAPSDGVNGRWLVFALQSEPVSAQLRSGAVGATIQGINIFSLKRASIPTPPLATQKAIASFLDHETSEIDTLVAKQERLIRLLQERRTSLVFHAVTQGLDFSAQMKASGLGWVESIPESWDAAVLRRFAKLESGHTPSRQHPEYWEACSIPWFTLADIWQVRPGIKEYVSETSECVSEVGLANSSARLLPAGTVLLSRTASVGFSAIAERPMATSQDFANWICGDRLLPEYLLYVFRGMRGEFLRLTMGSTHKTIYMPVIAKLAVPLPSVEEQRRIVDWIRREIQFVDALQRKAAKVIEHLCEYRSALIAAAIVGDIDAAGSKRNAN